MPGIGLSLSIGSQQQVVGGGGATGAPVFDNFNGNVIDVTKWTSGVFISTLATGGTVADTNSELEITPANGAAGYAGLISLNTASAIGKQIGIQRVNCPQGNAAYEFYLKLGPDASNGYALYCSGGTLFLSGFNAGTKTNVTSVADPDYGLTGAPTTYKWYRLYHDSVGDNIKVDGAAPSASTPPVPGDWVNILSAARSDTYWNKATTPNLKAAIGAGQWGTQASPLTLKFDNFVTDMAL